MDTCVAGEKLSKCSVIVKRWEIWKRIIYHMWTLHCNKCEALGLLTAYTMNLSNCISEPMTLS